MDENQRTKIVRSLIDRLIQSEFYANFVQRLQSDFEQECLLGRISGPATFKDDLQAFIKNKGYQIELKQTIYVIWNDNMDIQLIRVNQHHHPKEPLDYQRKAQIGWERRISKPLNNMCVQLGQQLHRKRSSSEEKEFEERWNELGVDELGQRLHGVDELRPVYAPRDFLDTLCRLRSPNENHVNDVIQTDTERARWNLMLLPLKAKTFDSLRDQFQELVSTASRLARLGINRPNDERTIFAHDYCAATILPSNLTGNVNTRDQPSLLTNRVAKVHYGPLSRQLVKLDGCPANERAQLWSSILGVNLTDQKRVHYADLKKSVIETELMIDQLMIRDVKLTASNDDQYFVFEDYLYQVMLLFSRDNEVGDHFVVSSATPLKLITTNSADTSPSPTMDILTEQVYPPNGIITFHGFTMLISPLCYVYDDPVMLYFIFRQFYTKYFFRLHTINSHPQGVLSLSILFESLLGSREPELCKHFQSRHIQPLRIAFKWLSRCFSGYLLNEDLLHLWDLILAYNTLEIIAVLAAAIVSFRRPMLIHIRSQQDAEAVLSDLSSIKVIPLIVNYLSTNQLN